MKKVFSLVLVAILVLTWSPMSFAASINVADATTVSWAASTDTPNYNGTAGVTTSIFQTTADGQDITGALVPAGAATGTLTFAGTSTSTAAIGTGASNNVGIMNLNGSAKTVTVAASSFVAETNFGADGTLSLNSGVNLTGAVEGVGATNNRGTLTLSGGSQTISGQVGTDATHNLKIVNAGANSATSTFSSDVFAVTLNQTGTGNIALNGNYAGILNYAANGTTTLADAKSLTGSVTNTTGAALGTLTLSGTSTVSGVIGTSAATGLTTINAGVAGKTATFSSEVHATTLSDTGTGNIALNGNFTGALAYAADGVVTLATGKNITGAVTTGGTNRGTLTYAGTSTTGGAIGATGAANRLTAVNVNGAVSLAHNIFATTATVNTGGTLTLTGNRTIEGTNFTLAGTGILDLGANTLTNTGIYTQGANNTLRVTLNSSSVFGNIASSGNAALTTPAISVTVSGALTPGAALKILDGAAGGTNGQAVTVTSSSPHYTFTGTNSAGDITITPTSTSSAVTTSANSTSVAAAFDGTSGTATGDMATVQNAVTALTSNAALDAAYAQMDPTANSATSSVGFTQVSQSLGTVTGHLADVRGAGISSGDEWKDAGIWVKGFGTYADQGTRSGIQGYKASMWGAGGGIDGLVYDETRVGFAGSYASTNVENKGEPGGTDVDSYQGTVYLGYDDPSPWYVNGAFSFTWNSYDASRAIVFTGVDRTANASYQGQQYTGLLDLGYVWKTTKIEKGQEWDITPTAAFTYSHLAINSYTETNAGDLSLHVNSQGYDLAQSSLGAKVSRPYKDVTGTYVPEIHGSWLYDFVGDPFTTAATFTGGGASFTTRGAAPAQSSFDVGAGLTFYSKGNISISAVYDCELKSKYTSHTGQATVRYNF